MAYEVLFSMPERVLERADVEFVVKSDGNMLGTLKVSKGSLVWFPAGTTIGHRISWDRFHLMMQDMPKVERRSHATRRP